MNYIVFSIAGTRGEATFTNQFKYILKANICEIQVNRIYNKLHSIVFHTGRYILQLVMFLPKLYIYVEHTYVLRYLSIERERKKEQERDR